MRIRRSPSLNFPPCEILVPLTELTGNPLRFEAKGGQTKSAHQLVQGFQGQWKSKAELTIGTAGECILLPVIAIESAGHNVLPTVLAQYLASATGKAVETSIVQINLAGHTGSDGWHRLAHPAMFDGKVQTGARYWLVDDFVGMGGTLANLRGFIEASGGYVIGCSALTGRADSSTLRLDSATLEKLRSKHGSLDDWWRWRFGYGTDCLTFAEARFLNRAENVDRVRDRMAAAGRRARIKGKP